MSYQLNRASKRFQHCTRMLRLRQTFAHGLTAKQLEIVGRHSSGEPFKAIGAELGISHKTVEWHWFQSQVLLGRPTLAAMVRWAVEHGWS